MIRKECTRMSTKRALLSAAASVVPVPFTDIATDVVLLKQIIPRISEKFGLSKEQIDEYNPQLAIFIYDVAKRFGTNMIGKYVTKELIVQILKKMGVRLTTKQVMKYVPVLGQAISAGISFTAMRFIIRSHINECYKVARTVIEANKVQPKENLK
ncbi:MAG: hypothetical protein NTX36_00350 [Proteobacteria bacterium]|nr:hypothetical protein [Pseudomonadota bacterium]